ncbi:B12-binding domain-containing radical SAM protein [Spirochaetota bacterium]
MKNNRVLLIKPPQIIYSHDTPAVVPPLGLAYLAAVFERGHIPVKIYDALVEDQTFKQVSPGSLEMHFGSTWDVIEKEIRSYAPGIVGITSSFSSQSDNALRTAEIVKKIDPGIFTVLGGAHPSSLPEDVLGNNAVDFVVIGEGEETTAELIKAISNGEREFSGIRGLGWKKHGKSVINEKRPLISDIDSIPLPARHLLPMDKYFNSKAWHSKVIKHKRFTSIITSRGCPNRCNYCSIYNIWGRKWRARDPYRVVDEIEMLVGEYGVREIHFEDDNLTLDRERSEVIFDEIIKRKLNIYWSTPNGVHIKGFSKDLFMKMRRSGCYRLHFGIEHGDAEFRKTVIRKPITQDNEKIKRLVKDAKDAGILVNIFLIIGFPQEKIEHIQKTIEMAKYFDPDTVSFFIATPHPSTDLYQYCVEHKCLPDGFTWTLLRNTNPVIETPVFTQQSIKEWRDKAYREFTVHKLKQVLLLKEQIRYLRVVRSWDDIKMLWNFFFTAIKEHFFFLS